MSVKTITLAKTLPTFRADCPVPGVSRRPVTTAVRDAEKINSTDKWRYRLAWAGLECAACGRSGSWVVEGENGATHEARMTFGHIVPLTMYGMTNIANLVPMHYACNRAAGERDLRGMIDYIVDRIPSKVDGIAYRDAQGYMAYEPESLPTESTMRMARKGRGLAF